jgi:hypothetical protein
LRIFIAIPFIFLGAFLLALTIDDISNLGNITMKILGLGSMLIGVLIGRRRKGS